MEDYTRIEKVGEGTYGVVFKGKNKKTGELVAIKKIRVDNEDDGIPATALREISLLKELVHPNIVLLKDVVTPDDKLYLIFEYLISDLKKFLESLKAEEYLSEETVKSYTYQILQAMLFCHKRRVLHRDLKPQNLLIAPNGLIKVADFGLGRTFGIPLRVYTHEIVTLWYRAPEVLLGSSKYSCAVDIWSIGCIFAELTTKKPLFRGDSEIDQLFRIFRILSTPNEETWPEIIYFPDYKKDFPNWTQNVLPSQVKGLGVSGLNLIQRMLTFDPLQRITAKEAIYHDYFDNLDHSGLPLYDD